MNNTTHPGPIPFATFKAEVLKLYQPPRKRPKTRSKVKFVLTQMAEICPTTDKLDELAIAGWLEGRKDLAAATHRSLLGTLRRICRYGARKGYLTNPFDEEPLSTWIPADELVCEPFAKHRSAEEIAQVLDQADAEAAAGSWHERRPRFFVYLLAYTGMHDAEARGLRRQDLDRRRRRIHIRSHPRRRLKTAATAALVAMADELVAAWDDWEPNIGDGCDYIIQGTRRTGPWNGGPPGYRPLDRVRQLGKRAGVHRLTIIAFRHTIGTEGDGWGHGENELQTLLRHARPETQKHYRHNDARTLHRAAGKIRYPRHSPPPPATATTPPPSPGA